MPTKWNLKRIFTFTKKAKRTTNIQHLLCSKKQCAPQAPCPVTTLIWVSSHRSFELSGSIWTFCFVHPLEKRCPKVIASLLHNISAYHRSQRKTFSDSGGNLCSCPSVSVRIGSSTSLQKRGFPNPKTFRFPTYNAIVLLYTRYCILFIVVCSQFEVTITGTVQSNHETKMQFQWTVQQSTNRRKNHKANCSPKKFSVFQCLHINHTGN